MKKIGVVLVGIATCVVLVNSVMADIIAPPDMPRRKPDKRPVVPAVGGYSQSSVTNSEVVAAAAFAIKAEAKALQEREDAPQPGKLELVKIVSAQQQVVAGINYRLKLSVKLDGKDKEAEAVVWHQVWRTPDPYRLTSWTWK